MAKIGAPVNYAAPEEIKKEQLKQSSSQGYQDLAEDVVLGIARAMGAMRPGGPSQAGAGPTAQREITSKSYQMDIERDVAASRCRIRCGYRAAAGRGLRGASGECPRCGGCWGSRGHVGEGTQCSQKNCSEALGGLPRRRGPGSK